MSPASFRAVLDTSAILAVLFAESGADRVLPVLSNAAMSAVNLSAVVAKLVERGTPALDIDRELGQLDLTIIPFDELFGLQAGRLHRATKGRNISLGDRAWLVTGGYFSVPAVTADRSWAELDIGVRIELIR